MRRVNLDLQAEDLLKVVDLLTDGRGHINIPAHARTQAKGINDLGGKVDTQGHLQC